MTDFWPVFVPSYGRAGKSQTLDWLKQHPDIVTVVCVEEEEFKDYCLHYPGFGVIVNEAKPHTIVGARQSILNHARRLNVPWYWQIDDTVLGVARRVEPRAKALRVNPELCLLEMQTLRNLHPRVALISPDFRHLAWAAKDPFKLNTRCMVITGTRTDTGCNYDLDIMMKEDIDFCLTALTAGWVTVLSHLHEIDEVPMGANKTGGMTELYAQKDFHARSCRQMARKWPRYVRMDKVRHGRPEIKTSWRAFLLRKNKV